MSDLFEVRRYCVGTILSIINLSTREDNPSDIKLTRVIQDAKKLEKYILKEQNKKGV